MNIIHSDAIDTVVPNEHLQMLHRLRMRLLQLQALLLPRLQLRIALAVRSRNSFFTLVMKLLHAVAETRRFSSGFMLLLLACLTARCHELPARGHELLHAIQRNRTQRFPVAFGPLYCSGGRSAENRKGHPVHSALREGVAPDTLVCLRLHLSHGGVESILEDLHVLRQPEREFERALSAILFSNISAAYLQFGQVIRVGRMLSAGGAAADARCNAAEQLSRRQRRF